VRARLNRVPRGWSAYFSYGALASEYEAVDQHVYHRTRHFSVNDTRCRGVERTSSPENMSPGSWPADAFDASAVGCRSRPCGEASRKAACGKSARPA
jgi:RNA-directed DNA polymerase